jgi:hypothetical protein
MCSDNPAWTYTDQFRHECEARRVMRLPKDEREATYAHVARARGPAAARELIEEVKRQWKLNYLR